MAEVKKIIYAVKSIKTEEVVFTSGMLFSSSVDTLHEAKVHRRAKRWFQCSSFKGAFRPINTGAFKKNVILSETK